MSRLSQAMRSRLTAMLLLDLVLMPRGVSQVAANFSANSAIATSAPAGVVANASPTFSTSTSLLSSSSNNSAGSNAIASKPASLQTRPLSLNSQPMSRLSSSAIGSATAKLYGAGNRGTLSASESHSRYKSMGTSRIVVAPSPKLGIISTGVRQVSGVGMGLRSGSTSGSNLSSSGLSRGFGYASSVSNSDSSSRRLNSRGRSSNLKKQSLREELGLPKRHSLHEELKSQVSTGSREQ